MIVAAANRKRGALFAFLCALAVPLGASVASACRVDPVNAGKTERGYGVDGEFIQATEFSVLHGSPVVDFGGQEILQVRLFRDGCRHEYYALAADCRNARAFHIQTSPVSSSTGLSYRLLAIHDWPSPRLPFRFLSRALEEAGVDSLESLFHKVASNEGEVRALSDLDAHERRREEIASDDLALLCKIHYPDSAGAKS